MAARCSRKQAREDGTLVDTVACCRLADHAGPCHQHFAGLIHPRPHLRWERSSGYAVECSEGAALDAAT